MLLRYRLDDGAVSPDYKTEGSSGLDLSVLEGLDILPGEIVLVRTGVYVQIPEGFEGQLRMRSSVALKRGLMLVNGVGTIDSDYRGEICVPVVNITNETQTLKKGERVAQLVISKYERVDLRLVNELSGTERGTGGFGSTGR